MAKTVPSDPLDELARRANRIDEIEAERRAEIRARNRDVVRLVDEGYAQDAVARAIRRRPTLVTKILASTNPAADDLLDAG